MMHAREGHFACNNLVQDIPVRNIIPIRPIYFAEVVFYMIYRYPCSVLFTATICMCQFVLTLKPEHALI